MTGQDPNYLVAIDLFQKLAEEAKVRGDRDVKTAALATSTPEGRPSVRTVNIARVSEAGLVFFANSTTGKGQQLAANPRAALCFHWPVLQHQVIVEGSVAVLEDAQADQLWGAIPREIGVGHWASDQLEPAAPHSDVREKAREYRQQFESARVPRAPGWAGYELHPDRIDFWPTGWQRLRARERFTRKATGEWTRAKDSP